MRSGGTTRTIFDGGCAAGDDCDDARAPVASAADGFAYGVAAGAGATYVAYVDLAGTTTVLHGNERAGADTRLVLGADGASVAWSEGATIRARVFATAAERQVAAARGMGGALTSLAVAGNRVLWSSRAGDGTTRVRLKVGGAAVVELASESGRRAVGGVALAGDGTAAFARRVVARGRARVEIVVVPPGGAPRVVARSSPYSGGAKAELPRLAAPAACWRSGCAPGSGGVRRPSGSPTSAAGGAKRVARVDRRRSRLSDPGVAPGRVVWARSDLGRDGRSLVRSRIVSAGVRAG